MNIKLVGISGIIVGVIAVWLFSFTLDATSTEIFCLSCHEMEIPKERLVTTQHGSNRLGIVADCSDCHIPKPLVQKIIRKIKATREVYGHLTGIINTPEKYEAHRDTMRQRELDRMMENNSAECRYCHNPGKWVLADQKQKARKDHKAMQDSGETCIECHDDAGHPVDVDVSDIFGMIP